MEKIKALGIEMVVADNTGMDPAIVKDLKRADREILPVNLIYPANYPEEPAILLEEFIFPSTVLKVLDRIEAIQEQEIATKPRGSALLR